MTVKKGKYQHYKGDCYEVLDIARHTENGDELVIYRALYNDYQLWARPLDMFLEDVIWQKKKQPRFKFVE